MGLQIEAWALREGVRQVQKGCGKAIQWCDGAGWPKTDDFDEADAEFWLRWAQDVKDCADAVVGIVGKLMAPSATGGHSSCALEDGHDGPCTNEDLHRPPQCPGEECDKGAHHEGPCTWGDPLPVGT